MLCTAAEDNVLPKTGSVVSVLLREAGFDLTKVHCNSEPICRFICLWQGGTWDALLFPFDLLYILLYTPISFESKILCECLEGSFSFTDLFLLM